MVETMRSIFRKIFIENWQRKVMALILAIIAWLVVNHSLTTNKTFNNIAVKVINIPPGKTVEGIQSNNILSKKIKLRIVGNKRILDDLTDGDLQVVLDAEEKTDEWIASISKKNLVAFNPDINIMGGISKVSHEDFIVKLTNIVTEKIPVIVTNPIGEAPRGYQFLDIWPYQLYVNVTGPEKIVKQLKSKGLKLTFNLNNISKRELDSIHDMKKTDEVSFVVPDEWKKISFPLLSEIPLQIDDPRAKLLRIDFSLTQNIPINAPIPVTVFYPLKNVSQLNPSNTQIKSNEFVKTLDGIKVITEELYARKTSRLFVDIVRDMIQILVIAAPKAEREDLLWNIQFIYPHELEDRYVAKILSDPAEEQIRELQPHLREEYLRNRFRSYMNRFRLFLPNNQKLSLQIKLEENEINIVPNTSEKM